MQAMGSGHLAAKKELLVRYLDAWLPAALHGHKRVCLVCVTASTDLIAAMSDVLTELSDLLEGHELTVVSRLPMTTLVGVSVTDSWSPQLGLPLAFLDGSDELLDSVIAVKGATVLAFLPQARELALPFTCVAHLVASDGAQETLLFGASSEKALEKFKEELWALDEFAGVQLRDPADPELLDIGLQAHLGPLRRILGARLAAVGAAPVSELRTFTARHTVYQSADAVRALHAMVAAAEARRSPTAGRLSATTIIEPAQAPDEASADERTAGQSGSIGIVNPSP
jgi:hypothetical protein